MISSNLQPEIFPMGGNPAAFRRRCRVLQILFVVYVAGAINDLPAWVQQARQNALLALVALAVLGIVIDSSIDVARAGWRRAASFLKRWFPGLQGPTDPGAATGAGESG